MDSWKSLLKADPTEWLLEEDNPSVRYFTLTDILGRPEGDSEVMKARQEIMELGVVHKILAEQADGGYWGIPEDFYVRAKYKGSVWQLIVMAERKPIRIYKAKRIRISPRKPRITPPRPMLSTMRSKR